MSDLVERLLKRAKDDQACADNSKVIVDALSEQMRLFESREGHNVYAVRMAVDHKSGMDRDNRYASDLREAASELERLRREVEEAKEFRAILEGHLAAAIDDYNEARKAAFIEAAEIAYAYECSLADYDGSVDAKHFYEGGVGDASIGISKALRAKAEEADRG